MAEADVGANGTDAKTALQAHVAGMAFADAVRSIFRAGGPGAFRAWAKGVTPDKVARALGELPIEDARASFFALDPMLRDAVEEAIPSTAYVLALTYSMASTDEPVAQKPKVDPARREMLRNMTADFLKEVRGFLPEGVCVGITEHRAKELCWKVVHQGNAGNTSYIDYFAIDKMFSTLNGAVLEALTPVELKAWSEHFDTVLKAKSISDTTVRTHNNYMSLSGLRDIHVDHFGKRLIEWMQQEYEGRKGAMEGALEKYPEIRRKFDKDSRAVLAYEAEMRARMACQYAIGKEDADLAEAGFAKYGMEKPPSLDPDHRGGEMEFVIAQRLFAEATGRLQNGGGFRFEDDSADGRQAAIAAMYIMVLDDTIRSLDEFVARLIEVGGANHETGKDISQAALACLRVRGLRPTKGKGATRYKRLKSLIDQGEADSAILYLTSKAVLAVKLERLEEIVNMFLRRDSREPSPREAVEATIRAGARSVNEAWKMMKASGIDYGLPEIAVARLIRDFWYLHEMGPAGGSGATPSETVRRAWDKLIDAVAIDTLPTKARQYFDDVVAKEYAELLKLRTYDSETFVRVQQFLRTLDQFAGLGGDWFLPGVKPNSSKAVLAAYDAFKHSEAELHEAVHEMLKLTTWQRCAQLLQQLPFFLYGVVIALHILGFVLFILLIFVELLTGWSPL